METITFGEFERVELRAGTIVRAEPFPEARKPAYKLTVDLGPLGLKQSSAQVTDLYSPEELVGKQVIACVNLGSRKIGPFLSEVLVTGFPSEQGVVLIAPDRKVENGVKLF